MAYMSNFITPEELYNHKNEYIILDARGKYDYKLGHIDGAYAVDIEHDLSGSVGVHGGRHPLPNMDELSHTLGAFGLTRDSKVLVYDSWIFLCGRLWWTLKFLGITHVKVLSGGIERWVREGYTLTEDETPLMDHSVPLDYKIQQTMVMTRDEVLQSSKSKDHIIIDARAPERYSGSDVDTMDGMTGHVPSAINYFFGHLYTIEGPRAKEELEEWFCPVLKNPRPIVTYCGSGVTACLTMLAMGEVGLTSALYVGSSSDWVTYEGFPLATGCEYIAAI